MKLSRPDVIVGAIELGGTNCHCAVGSGPGEKLLARTSFSSKVAKPSKLLQEVVQWFKAQEHNHGRLEAIGIASFGPLELTPNSPEYGFITNTPKVEWRTTNVVGPFKEAFDIPVGFNTDVNGAGFGEYWWGNAMGLDDFVYLTMGTGVGGGGMSGGKLLTSMLHPEMGHLLLPRLPGDTFEGACETHGRCWEGLCSGTALEKRTSVPAKQIESAPVWQQVADYTGIALANITLILSPRRIIIGGSVRHAGRIGEQEFFRMIRESTARTLNGYVKRPELSKEGIQDYIVPPKLGEDAGIAGALALGQCAFQEAQPS